MAGHAGPEGDMKFYKQHPIYGIGVLEAGRLWRPRGLVFATDLNCTLEIQRLEPTDSTFTTKKKAEEYALKLCKAWIDAQESEPDPAKESTSAKITL
ncbi:MAG: hypothetical protein ACM37Z_15320 [Deltaproteobacteria bacterium]